MTSMNTFKYFIYLIEGKDKKLIGGSITKYDAEQMVSGLQEAWGSDFVIEEVQNG